MKKLHPSAGIAIGPILFVLAILGILASVFSSGGGNSFGGAAVADRVTADIVSQANLIRAKIQECQMQYLVNGTNYAAGTCAGDPYPCSDQTNGTDAALLTCPNDPLVSGAEQSLWTGLRVASLPPATKGFTNWKYMNAGLSGGRCIWTEPTNGNASVGNVEGLKRAAQKFTSQELAYNPTGATQKFVVFITPATGTVDSHCTAP